MKEVKLLSGATLKITLSPFKDSRALYQAVLKEAKGLAVSSKSDITSLVKELFCIGFSSPEIELCLLKCMERCTYNSGAGDFRIDETTFEPEKAREDYMQVCIEVAKENVLPFVKSLYGKYQHLLSTKENVPT